VGRPYCCYHVESRQATFVLKETKTSWSLKRRPCILLSDQSWSMHARLGTRASQKIKQSRSKISSAVLSRSSSATSRTKKHVVCWTYLDPLSDRRRSLCSTLFNQIASWESHVLDYLLPAKRDAEVTCRLRSVNNSSRADKPLQKLFHTLWISKLSVSLAAVMCLYVCACVCLNLFYIRICFLSI